MDTPNSAVTGLRNGALTLVVAVLLFGVSSTAASADPSITPTPQPQGPLAREGGVNAPPPKVNPGQNGPCFSCAPNQIPPQAPAPGPGPAPTVTSPELTGSTQYDQHVRGQLLQIFGDHFTPQGQVHVDIFFNGGPSVASCHGDAEATGSKGTVQVTTDCNTSGAVDAYAVATDRATGRVSNHLPVGAGHYID